MTHQDHVLSLISRLQDRAYRFIISELKNRGISGIEPSHGSILRQLFIQGPLSMSRLATLIDRTKPTTTVLVRKLETHGYVEKTNDPSDRRIVVVRLTDKAAALVNDFIEISKNMREKLYHGLAEQERQQLVDLIHRAVNNFSEF